MKGDRRPLPPCGSRCGALPLSAAPRYNSRSLVTSHVGNSVIAVSRWIV